MSAQPNYFVSMWHSWAFSAQLHSVSSAAVCWQQLEVTGLGIVWKQIIAMLVNQSNWGPGFRSIAFRAGSITVNALEQEKRRKTQSPGEDCVFNLQGILAWCMSWVVKHAAITTPSGMCALCLLVIVLIWGKDDAHTAGKMRALEIWESILVRGMLDWFIIIITLSCCCVFKTSSVLHSMCSELTQQCPWNSTKSVHCTLLVLCLVSAMVIIVQTASFSVIKQQTAKTTKRSFRIFA